MGFNVSFSRRSEALPSIHRSAPTGDIATAQAYGERVAWITVRLASKHKPDRSLWLHTPVSQIAPEKKVLLQRTYIFIGSQSEQTNTVYDRIKKEVFKQKGTNSKAERLSFCSKIVYLCFWRFGLNVTARP